MSRADLTEAAVLDASGTPWYDGALSLTFTTPAGTNRVLRLVVQQTRDAFGSESEAVLDLEGRESAAPENGWTFPSTTTATVASASVVGPRRHRWYRLWYKDATTARYVLQEGWIDTLPAEAVTVATDPAV